MNRQIIASLLAVLLTSVVASNKHLICKTVADVFSEALDEHRGNRNETTLRGGQGIPGKRGPVGPRGLLGPRGLKGEAGYVDYNNISEIVEGKVCEGLTAVLTHLNAIREDITLIKRGQSALLQCPMTTNLLYNGTCYITAQYSSSQHLNREQAKQACHKIGYELARIRDKDQQEALENFVRPRVSSGAIYFWIDLIYDIGTNTLQYESGENVLSSQVTWYPGYPSSSAGRTYIMLRVRKTGNDGIWNYVDYNAQGALCEKTMIE